MAPTKLSYFNVTALGEPIRYLLSYGGVEFEDERHTAESLAAIKSTLPLGQLPILQIEGKTLFQSTSICRFLANRFKLVGKDEFDSLQCDIAVDTIGDVRSALAQYSYEKNEAAKKEKYEETMTKVAFLLEKLEGHLVKKEGHFLKGNLSWADFWFAGLSGYLNYMAGKDLFADKPQLKALKQKIEALPAISKYLEKRPACPF